MNAGAPQDTCPKCGYAATFPCIVDLVDVVTFAKACAFCGTVRPSAATAPQLVTRLELRRRTIQHL
ncbi:hypothetical protein ACR5MH_0735 (plasmid) [Streptomyces sp. L7]|uniref:hypothetical protein n=1 Tax=Streptomyces sp. L7 TaxID=3423954 RepID=UPI000E1FE062|nr:hypothetical protein DOE76_15130 [Leifsonia sp. ku-ls]